MVNTGGSSHERINQYPSILLKDQMNLIKTALDMKKAANNPKSNLTKFAESQKGLHTDGSGKELVQRKQKLRQQMPDYMAHNVISHDHSNEQKNSLIMNIKVPNLPYEKATVTDLNNLSDQEDEFKINDSERKFSAQNEQKKKDGDNSK